MKYVELTQGKVALVDDEDYEYLSQWKWCATKSRHCYYAERREKGKHIKMHRILMGVESGVLVDHINGEGLDNQKHNLRPATQSQNAFNRMHGRVGKSGVRGVHLRVDKTGIAYQPMIKVDGKNKSLGYFRDLDLAAQAYQQAVVLVSGRR